METEKIDSTVVPGIGIKRKDRDTWMSIYASPSVYVTRDFFERFFKNLDSKRKIEFFNFTKLNKFYIPIPNFNKFFLTKIPIYRADSDRTSSLLYRIFLFLTDVHVIGYD